MQDKNCRHREGVGEGAAIGSFHEDIDQDCIGQMIKDVRSEKEERPVVRSERSGAGPVVKLAEDPGDGAESNLRA